MYNFWPPYIIVSYIVLVLSSAVTDLSNKTLILHDFQGAIIKFHDIPGLENEILKFHDFPGFPWPVRILKYLYHVTKFSFYCRLLFITTTWKSVD